MQATGPDIAWVDTIDACHLRCPTCVRGLRGLENSASRMDLGLFERVVGRLREQGFRRVGLFNWTEPFLNRTIETYVATAKAAGFCVSLSSTLSLPRVPNLEATLLAGLDLLTVSVSGSDQETYEINHVGGVWEYVTANLRRVRDAIDRNQGLHTRIDLRMLRFNYNAHQEPRLREFAEELGFCFEVIEGVGDPMAVPVVARNEDFEREVRPPARAPSPEDEGKACELMFNQMAIDCRGDAYLCCATPNYPALRLGRFLELSADELLVKKFTHAVCRSCTMPRRERAAAEESRLSAALQAAGLSRKPISAA